jgi:hypothetical protein
MQKDIDQRIQRIVSVFSRSEIEADDLTPFEKNHLYTCLVALEGKLLLFNAITNSTALSLEVSLPSESEGSEPLISDDIRSLSAYMNMVILHASSSVSEIDASALPMRDILCKIAVMKTEVCNNEIEVKMIRRLLEKLEGGGDEAWELNDEDLVLASKYHFLYTPIVGGEHFGNAIRAFNNKIDLNWVNEDYDAVISLVTYMVYRAIFTDKFNAVVEKAKKFESRADLNKALDRLVKAKS